MVLSIIALLPSLNFAEGKKIDFTHDILPIFKESCFECHSSAKDKPKGDLRLDSKEFILKAIKEKEIAYAGDPESSDLLYLVDLPLDDEDRMPPPNKGRPLSKDEIQKLRDWVSQGFPFGDWVKASGDSIPRPKRVSEEVKRQFPALQKEFPDLKAQKKIDVAAKQIDQLIYASLKEKELKPNAVISDEVFLRRIYLDIAGRIPNLEETRSFLENKNLHKRAKLINTLLHSEAYGSHAFNKWADIFRIVSRGMNNGSPSIELFGQWLKESLQNNMPYDKMIYEILTSTGEQVINPKVGYWYRDYNMPLDNLAVTTQIFLGTKMDCAMCHDHPRDVWTQKDFYETAAFLKHHEQNAVLPKWVNKQMLLDAVESGGQSVVAMMASATDSVPMMNDTPMMEQAMDMQERQMADFGKKKFKGKQKEQIIEHIKSTPIEVFQYTLSYNKQGKMFRRQMESWVKSMGEAHKVKIKEDGYSTREEQREVDRHLRTLKNLIEINKSQFTRGKDDFIKLPKNYQYDDAKPNEKISANTPFGNFHSPDDDKLPYIKFAEWLTSKENPKFTKVIANRLFSDVMGIGLYEQHDDIKATDKPSHPELMALLERQMKESNYNIKRFLSILYNTRMYQSERWNPVLNEGQQASWPFNFEGPAKGRLSAEQLWDSLVSMMLKEPEARKRIFILQDPRFDKIDHLPPDKLSDFAKMMADEMYELKTAQHKKYKDFQNFSYLDISNEPEVKAHIARASELKQPTYPNHFLREFGQSDRMQIENANDLSNVPQTLRLLNSFIDGHLFGQWDKKQKRFKEPLPHMWSNVKNATNDKERIENLYLSILNRPPSEEEWTIIATRIDPNKDHEMADLVWALINTEEFRFIP